MVNIPDCPGERSTASPGYSTDDLCATVDEENDYAEIDNFQEQDHELEAKKERVIESENLRETDAPKKKRKWSFFTMILFFLLLLAMGAMSYLIWKFKHQSLRQAVTPTTTTTTAMAATASSSATATPTYASKGCSPILVEGRHCRAGLWSMGCGRLMVAETGCIIGGHGARLQLPIGTEVDLKGQLQLGVDSGFIVAGNRTALRIRIGLSAQLTVGDKSTLGIYASDLTENFINLKNASTFLVSGDTSIFLNGTSEIQLGGQYPGVNIPYYIPGYVVSQSGTLKIGSNSKLTIVGATLFSLTLKKNSLLFLGQSMSCTLQSATTLEEGANLSVSASSSELTHFVLSWPLTISLRSALSFKLQRSKIGSKIDFVKPGRVSGHLNVELGDEKKGPSGHFSNSACFFTSHGASSFVIKTDYFMARGNITLHSGSMIVGYNSTVAGNKPITIMDGGVLEFLPGVNCDIIDKVTIHRGRRWTFNNFTNIHGDLIQCHP